MPTPFEVPQPTDANYLERAQGYIDAARAFRGLIEDLSTEDVSDDEYLEAIPEARVDEDGRFSERYPLAHGHYTVIPTGLPEIDPVTEVHACIALSRSDGGRVFAIDTVSSLSNILVVNYFEDMPLVSGLYEGNEDVLNRFKLAREVEITIGIHFSDIKIIDALTKNIRAVRDAGRLEPSDNCSCYG